MTPSSPFQQSSSTGSSSIPYPLTYVAPRISDSFQIDGDLTKYVWQNAPWSSPFDDIRGVDDAPPDERPRPTCRTRMKMLWDDLYLYIGAEMESDFTTTATFTERNSVIFSEDSDIEVFLDPLGSCHSYKEYEANALATVWNLMLDKPYADGGAEHSGRVAKPGEPFYYEVSDKQLSATKLLKGKLNDPSQGATYSIEIRMAFSDILAHILPNGVPTVGARWRINFSRVEKKGDINWTWQPQIAWDPTEHRYKGYVDMHRPDAWGYLIFGDGQENAAEPTPPQDPTHKARLAAMSIYYAQQEYHKRTGEYAWNLRDLSTVIDQTVVGAVKNVTMEGSGTGFLVTVTDKEATVTVRDDRLVTQQLKR